MAKKSKTKTKLKRTPVIAVMGHVDHGKTSLLDAIRGTKVQASEVGGITQNTRAHQIDIDGQKVTFIDTPGHEAFSEMRSRGAKVTDIVLLVVAADDGVQPQTKESIKFALEEKVPVIVAINKVDLQAKNIAKLKQQLSSENLLLEEFGGDVMAVEVSAVKETGLDELLESILLLAEINELKKTKVKVGSGSGFILESHADKHLGPVALALVKSGEIRKGDSAVYEDGDAKVRDVLNEKQEKMDVAEEGDPVWLIGLKEVLKTGDTVRFFDEDKAAKEFIKEVEKGNETIVEEKETEDREMTEEEDMALLAEFFGAAQKEEDTEYLNIVLRTDTQGTLEVVMKQLEDLSDDEVKVKVLDAATGDITEQDVKTALAAKGIVMGFQVETPKKVQELARKERVLVRNYEVIYDLIDEVGEVLDGLGQPIEEEVEVSRAKVKKAFQLSNGQYVAGCEVIKGTVLKGYRAYIERDEEKVGDGKITSLKKLKNEVKEVKKGEECGILLEPNFEILEGDEIVCYKIEKL